MGRGGAVHPAPVTPQTDGWLEWEDVMDRWQALIGGIGLSLVLGVVSSAVAEDAFRSPPVATSDLPPIVRVTGAQGLIDGAGGYGVRGCGGRFCGFEASIVASDERLTGEYMLELSDYDASDGTVGSIIVCKPGRCPWGDAGDPSWEGEWVTATELSLTTRESTSFRVPVTTIWLHGRAENEGLTALLRLGPGWSLEGTLFKTPQAPWAP
jgi:hypothetical protein